LTFLDAIDIWNIWGRSKTLCIKNCNKPEYVKASIMTGATFSYHHADSIKLLCEIDLKKLLPIPKERNRFDKNWNDFIESDQCNKEIFERNGNTLRYQSETKKGNCCEHLK